ncbi:MAG: hypothetical protein ACT6Q8_21550 [Niveispirillum sp.]|uniref:hypothetical protein n=1 Tax=Niveispirillum sp. TaxID=1917217 RepID=UPI0006B99B5F
MTDQSAFADPFQGMASYQTDLFIPRYTLSSQGRWSLRTAPFSISSGYWTPAMPVHDMVALIRDGNTWMSTAPLELESQEIGIRHAGGHVLIYGMGMGWCAVNCALLPAVTRVTVVELDPDILELHRELDLASQLPADARAKLHIVQGDAYKYVPDLPVDLLMPDIWLPLMNDTRVEEVQRMQEKVKAARVYFWGQELELARHAVAAGRALDDAGIAATAVDFGLPLLGPELPDYTARLRSAARQHMRDRWLPGPPPPADL